MLALRTLPFSSSPRVPVILFWLLCWLSVSDIATASHLRGSAFSQSADSATSAEVRPPLCVPALSCSLQRVPDLDGCCINDPSGHFLQTQFWDPQPALGAKTTWTVHGLWPDWCSGGFDAFCDHSRNLPASHLEKILSNASSNGMYSGLIEWMMKHWLSLDGTHRNLWAHEWNKHGTCISTLEPKCYARDQLSLSPSAQVADADILDYFAHTALLYSSLPTYDFLERHGIVPSYETTYELEHLRRAVWDSPHGSDVTFKCRNGDELSEIWYSFYARGSLRSAMELWKGNHMWNTWVAAVPTDQQKTNCPEQGIRYLPKHAKGDPLPPTRITETHTATATATHTSRPTTPPFTGRGRLMVKVIADERGFRSSVSQQVVQHDDVKVNYDEALVAQPLPTQYTGCLIRKGNWFLARSLTSCAIFTADDDVKSSEIDSSVLDDDLNYHLFTLASRFAPCSFVESNGYDTLSGTQSDESADLSTVGSMFFSCSHDLPFQTILSNDATIGRQHTEAAKRLTLGRQHKSIFYAEAIPQKAEQLKIWTDSGWGTRKVKVEIYWEGV